MKAVLPGLVLTSVMLLAAPATAQMAGPWKVSGDIAGRAFVVDCRFEPRGAEFGGVCVEAASGDPKLVHAGKSHPVTKATVSGEQVSWSYPASFMLAKFDVSFSGALAGDRIAGKVSAAGRTGAFTAVRK
jgi:hypothetical protein